MGVQFIMKFLGLVAIVALACFGHPAWAVGLFTLWLLWVVFG